MTTKTVDKQQLLHYVSEIVVLFGLVFWFQRKVAVLNNHIDDLEQRMDEQDEIIRKHDNIIQKMLKSQTLAPVQAIAPNALANTRPPTPVSTPVSPTVYTPEPEPVRPTLTEQSSVLDEEIKTELAELQ
jgi:hypothetical protein